MGPPAPTLDTYGEVVDDLDFSRVVCARVRQLQAISLAFVFQPSIVYADWAGLTGGKATIDRRIWTPGDTMDP